MTGAAFFVPLVTVPAFASAIALYAEGEPVLGSLAMGVAVVSALPVLTFLSGDKVVETDNRLERLYYRLANYESFECGCVEKSKGYRSPSVREKEVVETSDAMWAKVDLGAKVAFVQVERKMYRCSFCGKHFHQDEVIGTTISSYQNVHVDWKEEPVPENILETGIVPEQEVDVEIKRSKL